MSAAGATLRTSSAIGPQAGNPNQLLKLERQSYSRQRWCSRLLIRLTEAPAAVEGRMRETGAASRDRLLGSLGEVQWEGANTGG